MSKTTTQGLGELDGPLEPKLVSHRSGLAGAQTSPYASAIGVIGGEAEERIPTSQRRRGNNKPPLPPDIALAYRINDAAKVSGLSRSTLYNLIAEKKLRSILVAGRRLIPADALRQLLRGVE